MFLKIVAAAAEEQAWKDAVIEQWPPRSYDKESQGWPSKRPHEARVAVHAYAGAVSLNLQFYAAEALLWPEGRPTLPGVLGCNAVFMQRPTSLPALSCSTLSPCQRLTAIARRFRLR